MRKLPVIVTIPAACLALAACQTTDDDDWIGGETTPFNQAERSCEGLTDTITEASKRAQFFTGCMKALGWTPKSGTDFATPATAPDPT